VQSTVDKESCNKTALKRCTSTEMRWYKKPVSLDSPVFREISKPISFNRLLAEVLKVYYGSIFLAFSTAVIHLRHSAK